jgi:hypothetical protein
VRMSNAGHADHVTEIVNFHHSHDFGMPISFPDEKRHPSHRRNVTHTGRRHSRRMSWHSLGVLRRPEVSCVAD